MFSLWPEELEDQVSGPEDLPDNMVHFPEEDVRTRDFGGRPVCLVSEVGKNKHLLDTEGSVPDDPRFQDVPAVGPVGARYAVGPGPGLYRRFEGPFTGWVPVPSPGRTVYVESQNWVPSDCEVRAVVNEFMLGYDREVVVLCGIQEDGQWFFVVPDQTTSSGSAEYNDSDAVAYILERGTFAGTLHTHPGGLGEASGRDINDWRQGGRGGMHIVAPHGGKEWPVYGAFSQVREDGADGVIRLGKVLASGPDPEDRKARKGGFYPLLDGVDLVVSPYLRMPIPSAAKGQKK